NDVAVGRDDEARAERARFAGPGLGAVATAVIAAAAALLLIGVEPAEELLERIGLRFDRHPLLGRNIDHRGLQLGDEVGERHRRTGAWRKRGGTGRVLRNLSARLPRGERECSSPQKQGHRDPVGIAHFSGLLRFHRYSINWLWTQGANRSVG